MYATQAMTHVVPLAQDLDQNKVTPGVLGFIVFAVMAGGVWMLMKSMNRHMNMVNFEERPEPGEKAEPTPAATAAEPRGE
ncbi:hypothetical protein [Streptomyces corynorhini]|uniref:Uncharacterized protein n=1 Tax=Streptomyces corynorhini TaxID=2282652 RepID=A0A370B3M5_9ACTN|nr:hypothetical protein [Streptomyces corynorhini]RDG35272.1 hypothetical protein DVH02_26185 [Streptomyces corynorhini]